MSSPSKYRRFGSRARALTGVGGATTLAADTFDRAAAALTTASDGGTWTTIGTWNTNGTQATCATPSSAAIRNAGRSDYTVQIKVVNADLARGSFMWRRTDDNNYFRFAKSDDNTWYVTSFVAGATTNYFADLVPIANGDVITIIVAGTTHTIKRNGTTVFTKTYTELPTGTWTGPATSPSLVGTAIYDDYAVTA